MRFARSVLIPSLSIIAVAACTVFPPSTRWTGIRQFGVSGSPTYATALATDPSGNVVVAGYTGGALGGAKTGSRDFFVRKFDVYGEVIWTRQLGTAPDQTIAYGLAVDLSGNVFVAGSTQGDLDGNTSTSAPLNELFVTKYDSSGNKQWTKQLGTGSGNTTARAASLDSSGNLYVAGGTTGNLGGNTAIGTTDFFAAKYDTAGNLIWTRQLGVASKYTEAFGVASDPSGNTFVVGVVQAGLDGNTLAGTDDLFVTKYNTSGTKQWTRQLGIASKATRGVAANTDASGNLYIAGDTTGGVDGNVLTGSKDALLVKYDTNGARQWTRQLGVSSATASFNSVRVSVDGTIVVGGGTNGALGSNTLTGTDDAILAQYTASGALVFVKLLGAASSYSLAGGVATNPSGEIFFAGYTLGALTGTTLTGTTDAYVAKYSSIGLLQ